MSGFLFPHMSQGPSDFYMARGKLSANGVGNWNNATALGSYEAPANEYSQYTNAGPLTQDGVLQVHGSGMYRVQFLTYANGQTYSRVSMNIGAGTWTPWILIGGTVVVGSPTPVGSPAPVGTPVGSPVVPVGTPVGTPVGSPAPVGSPVVPVGSPAPVGSPVIPVGSPVIPVGSPVIPVGSPVIPVGSPVIPVGSPVIPVGSPVIPVGSPIG